MTSPEHRRSGGRPAAAAVTKIARSAWRTLGRNIARVSRDQPHRAQRPAARCVDQRAPIEAAAAGQQRAAPPPCRTTSRPGGATSRAASQHKCALRRPTGAPPASNIVMRERRKDSASSASFMRTGCASCIDQRSHIARSHRATIAPARAFVRLREGRRRARRRPGGRIKISTFRF
ncbi:hypothetical protein F511_46875 [Dorcoceras hygrometricum]|uniref:Uncharacterized protein n=1 Tax=Dorcoceras hygrometricum TaxID=472368 RepID=A0A2Z6ZZQ8_9LAMI|nr:hypothetical protein F511_46875 [Dorcoceras hygrometricum]